MSDNLSRDESAGLDEVAEWLDALYLRLQGADLMLATDDIKGDEYCESLQDDLDTATQTGIAAGRTMEHCSILFEQLNGGAVPNESLVKARSEINALAVVVRQMANQPPEPPPVQPPDPWALHCETMEAEGYRHSDTAKSWKAAHPEDRRSIAEVKKASENYRAERNRKRKAAGNPP